MCVRCDREPGHSMVAGHARRHQVREALVSALAGQGVAVEHRVVFGHHAIYVGPALFGYVAPPPATFSIRPYNAAQRKILAAAGIGPPPGAKSAHAANYWPVPDALLHDASRLAGLAREFAAAAPPPKARKRAAPAKTKPAKTKPAGSVRKGKAAPSAAAASIVTTLALCVVMFVSMSQGASAAAPRTQHVTINNLLPRLNASGVIMDAHDGSIQRFPASGDPGAYYMHSAAYGLCKEPAAHGCDQTPTHCGFRDDHNITVYRSYNLSSGSWEMLGTAIAPSQRPAGVLFRPHAVYNPSTGLAVLWWNYNLKYAAATAPGPAGPFVTVNDDVNVTRGHHGDFALFVDPVDGTGYVVYSANYWMSIEQLTPDFLHSTGRNASIVDAQGSQGPLFPDYFIEAPVMFERQGTYYVLYGHCW